MNALTAAAHSTSPSAVVPLAFDEVSELLDEFRRAAAMPKISN